MANVKVELNSKGIREMLKSQAVENELTRRMKRVQSALPGSELESTITRTRVRVKVMRGSDFEESNTGELSRALDLAGGLRGQFTKNQLAAKRAKARARGRFA